MKKYKNYVEYHSNNSGGGWWLDDKDWEALEKAGWKVRWAKTNPYRKDSVDKNGRWLGALATEAIKPNAASLEEAVREWETVTGKSSTEAGCPCCGQPHYFSFYKNGKFVASGPTTRYEASWE